jgi:excisionase family DNA binding protein
VSKPPVFVSSKQIAVRWGVTSRTIERMAANGVLPSVRVGAGSGVLRFPLSAIEAFEAPSQKAA